MQTFFPITMSNIRTRLLKKPGCFLKPERIGAVAKGPVRIGWVSMKIPMRTGRHCRSSEGRTKRLSPPDEVP